MIVQYVALEREQKKVDADIKKSRVLLQKGIEKMLTVRANIESMLTTITLNKGEVINCH